MKKPRKRVELRVIRMPKGRTLGTRIHKDRRKETIEETHTTKCYFCNRIILIEELPHSLNFGTEDYTCIDCWAKICEGE